MDGGDITLSYEWYDDSAILGNSRSNSRWTIRPGARQQNASLTVHPGTISIGAPATTYPGGFAANLGTYCTNCFSIPQGAGRAFNPINGGIGPTAPFSGSTLNWTTSSRGEHRHERHKKRIQPLLDLLFRCRPAAQWRRHDHRSEANPKYHLHGEASTAIVARHFSTRQIWLRARSTNFRPRSRPTTPIIRPAARRTICA